MKVGKKKKLLFIFILIISSPVIAQREAAVWYFGNHAGLDFNNCNPIALTDGQLTQIEGCATIADSSGNLLFYTDGIDVYNANHTLMPNGTGLNGNPSSSQSAIIIPKPASENLFYIFTVDAEGGPNGLSYTLIDMNLEGGLGDVVLGNKNIQLHTPVAEKLTATYHANGEDIWVISHEINNINYIAYLVSQSGVAPAPVVSGVGETHFSGLGAIGCLKASPDGKKLASTKGFAYLGAMLLDFDNATGIISNPQKIHNYSAYGVEFSPNSKLLYVTNMCFAGQILQYDITLPTSTEIRQSETIIASDYKHATLQLAIDGKIYAAQTEFGGAPIYDKLSVINKPNEIGLACNYQEDAIDLAGKHSRCGLPPFIQNYFQYEMAYSGEGCLGKSVSFEINSFSSLPNVSWDFGDPGSGSSNTASGMSVTHLFSAPGIYTVTALLTTDLICSNTITLTREVIINPVPTINQPLNLIQCDIDVFNLTQVVSEMISSDQNPSDFNITYYRNHSHAEAGIPETEISKPDAYTIETLPQQTIYVRVENKYGCYDITSFEIIVNPKAVVDLSDYDGMAICVDLNPNTPTIGGNYEPISIDTGLFETDYVFSWSLDGEPLSETGPSVLADIPGEYTVAVTDIKSTDLSCMATSSATILQSNPPEFDAEAVFFEGNIIISNVSGNGDYEFSIDQNSWTSLGENNKLVLTTNQTGPIKVYGHDKNGCGMTIKEVWMLGFMKFFTPNQDGFNDRWKILGLERQPEANLYIFDRYGKLLESLSPVGAGWDGHYKGHPMPANDYWFRLEYKSSDGTPKIFQDSFTLMR